MAGRDSRDAHGRSRSKGRHDMDRELIEATPPAMSDFAAMLKSVFASEGIAKREDLQALSTRLDKQEHVQTEQGDLIRRMEESLAAMASELQSDRDARKEEWKAQSSSYVEVAKQAAQLVQQAPRRSPATTETWCPTTINIRGFSPYNSGNDSKLSREEFRHEGDRLHGLLPPSLQKMVSLCQPFALNHQVSFRLQTKSRDEVFEVVSECNHSISAKNHRIRGSPLRASTEIHPDRRAQFRNAYSAVELLTSRGIPKTRFDLCERSLRLYAMPGHSLAGSTCTTTQRWTWTAEGKAALGLEGDVDM